MPAPSCSPHFKPRGLLRRIGNTATHLLDRLLTDEVGSAVQRHAIDARDAPVCAFLGPQKHLATEFCGEIDPTDLDEYLRHDGFQALRRCALERSAGGDRRRGSIAAGFEGAAAPDSPPATSGPRSARPPGDAKYVVCNGDEGDPGAFMDRMILESFPYRVIEGMAIAARAVGADEGFFYIRAEYPLAVERIREALDRCRERGFLGDYVLRQRVPPARWK